MSSPCFSSAVLYVRSALGPDSKLKVVPRVLRLFDGQRHETAVQVGSAEVGTGRAKKVHNLSVAFASGLQ
jgi:hypothetical protein